MTPANSTPQGRARAIRAAGGIDAALAAGVLPKLVDTTLSEALVVIGLLNEAWQRPALTQPAAIIVADFAKEIGAAKFFNAGDVQANGFQIVEDDRTGDTFTETGASYMGFAPGALLASALAEEPRYGIAFCGDGSFGGLGAWGQWNVGNWCDDVQKEWIAQDL